MIKSLNFILSILLICLSISAQKVDYACVNVPEESGLELMQITSDNDNVAMPVVKRTVKGIGWVSSKVIDVTPDGNSVGFISLRGTSSNIFIKALSHKGAAVQRTNRSAVQSFSFSHDGKSLCFSEAFGNCDNLFLTDANNGFVCREITNGSKDYSPVYSLDDKQIFFGRMESGTCGIWSYDLDNKYLSNYSEGANPASSSTKDIFYCTRTNGFGRGEIYRVNYGTGYEECIVSDVEKSFTSPQLSPDGQWIVFVGSSKLPYGKQVYWDTDVYACRIDGTDLVQLTYHAADDLSPVWDVSGKFIYFISQRGSANAIANVWRLKFGL